MRTFKNDFKDLMNTTVKIWSYASNNGKSTTYEEGDEFKAYKDETTKTIYQNGIQVDSDIQIFCDPSVEVTDRDQLEIEGRRYNILKISKKDGGRGLYALVIYL